MKMYKFWFNNEYKFQVHSVTDLSNDDLLMDKHITKGKSTRTITNIFAYL